MISERSANRGACAQSCRKDYVLNDEADGEELDRGYLISAKDLGALGASGGDRRRRHRVPQDRRTQEEAGVCRDGHAQAIATFLDRLAEGALGARRPRRKPSRWCRSSPAASPAGCTAGARARLRDPQPARQSRRGAGHGDRHEGNELRRLRSASRSAWVTAWASSIPTGSARGNTGFAVTRVRTISSRDGRVTPGHPPPTSSRRRLGGGAVSQASLLDGARASFAGVDAARRRTAHPARCRSSAAARGSPLTLHLHCRRRQRHAPECHAPRRRRPSDRSTTRASVSSSAAWARRRSRSARSISGLDARSLPAGERAQRAPPGGGEAAAGFARRPMPAHAGTRSRRSTRQ